MLYFLPTRTTFYGSRFVWALTFLSFCLLIPSRGNAQDVELVTLNDTDSSAVLVEGFILDRASTISIDAVVPRSTRDRFGNAWILNAATREPVWDLLKSHEVERRGSLHVVNTSLQLPAGSYEVYYASNTRDPGRADWWENVESVGDLIASVLEEVFGGTASREDEDLLDQAGIRIRAERGFPESDLDVTAGAFLKKAFITLIPLTSDQFAQQGFSLDRSLDIGIYAIGEGTEEEMFDYGWILNADTRETVWRMDPNNTKPAGGARVNRSFYDSVRLAAGNYTVFFVTDPWNAPGDWEDLPPFDPDFWGVTLLLPHDSLRAHVALFDNTERALERTIADLTGIGDDRHETKRFTLSTPQDLLVYALGEGNEWELYDYGWISDVKTGRRVWAMAHEDTRHAGGARKNRMYTREIHLPAGDYELHFVTDGSHSYDGWNAPPPFDPSNWGITLLKP